MNKQLLLKLKKSLSLTNHSTPYKWASGRNGVSKKAAKKLEALTGIPRLHFLYPEEYSDPWPRVEEFLKSHDL